jgi:hypothetical protein
VQITSKQHHGTSLDSFLEEERIFEESQALAIKEVVAWQLTEAMEKQSLSKARLAKDQPLAGRPLVRPHTRRDPVDPAARRRTGGPQGTD